MSFFYTHVSEYKGKILHIGYKNGQRFCKKHNFMPSLYIKTDEPTKWSSIYDEPLKPIVFETIGKYRDYLKNYKDYLKPQGEILPKFQAIEHYYKEKLSPNNSQINTCIWDIEVISDTGEFPYPQYANHPITSIVIKSIKHNKILAFGLKDYENSRYYKDAHIRYYKCDNEEILLRQFLLAFEELEVDVLCGWYSDNFDVPYVINRITKVLGKEQVGRLSPVGKVSTSEMHLDNGRVEFRNVIQGVELLDYQRIYMKYRLQPRESYSLNFISSYELGTEKVNYEEYDSLGELWKNDHQKFIEYNIKDVELIEMLDDELKFFDLHYTLTHMYKCNFEDTMGTVTPWDCFINFKLRQENKVPPFMERKEFKPYAGAYVHDPKPGVYEWLASGDLTSLYPMCVIQYNISPETIIDNVFEDVKQTEIDDRLINREIKVNQEHILAGNGQYFSKTKQGVIPKLMQEVFNERKKVKKEMLALKQKQIDTGDESLKTIVKQKDMTQLALKISINSAYGFLSNKYSRYYDYRLASAITLSGQLAIKSVMREFPKEMVAYCDTDSLFLVFDKQINMLKQKYPDITTENVIKYLSKLFDEKIQPIMNNNYDKLYRYMNCNENKMEMKVEKICSSGLWVAKKKYAVMVHSDEGVIFKEPELKVTGLEIKRSSTPAIIKPFLQEIIIKILNNDNDELIDYIKYVKEEFYKMSPEQIAFPRSVDNISKYYRNGEFLSKCPINVRAAVTYNKYIEDNMLSQYYSIIMDGNKFKYIYMKEPSPLGQNVFGFIRKIPSELEKYVDYKNQFEKAFLKPVRNVTDAIGLDVDINKIKTTNLSDLF